MQDERFIQNNILVKITGDKIKLWPNDRGLAYIIKPKQKPRPIKYGLGPEGASDLIGYTIQTITPDMVGKQVAIFTAIEVKTPTGKIRPAQKSFIEKISLDGGIAFITRSVEAAEQTLADFLK